MMNAAMAGAVVAGLTSCGEYHVVEKTESGIVPVPDF
jgi:hypothetical protein